MFFVSHSARDDLSLKRNRKVKMRVWLILAYVCLSFGVKAVDPVFHRLTTENGLSSAYVTSILQDRQGYIWIGTSEGLNRYDGESFHVFHPEKGDPYSIQGNTIEKLFEDDAGYIWIYFSSGEISYFDPATGAFTNYTKEWLEQQVRVYGKVFCFSSAVPSQTWIGTENGLLVFTHKTRVLQRMQGSNSAVYNAPVSSIYQAASRMVLLGTPNGFSLYNSLRKDFTDYPLRVYGDPNASLSQLPGINCMYRDRNGYLWIGTEKVGAYRTIRANDELIFQAVGPQNRRIYQFTETPDGNFWIGHNEGATLIRSENRSALLAEDFFNHPEEAGGEQVHVRNMVKDKEGNVWFLDNRFDQGLFYFSSARQQIERLRHLAEDPYSIGSNQITSISVDRLNNIWLGHENYGVSYASLHALPFDYTFGYTADSLSLSSNQVFSVWEDSFGDLWVATASGLDCMDWQTREIHRRFTYDLSDRSKGLSGKRIGSLTEDKDQYLWITYYDALPDRINLQTGEIERFPVRKAVSSSLPKAITDATGKVWFSTPEKEWIRYDSQDGEIRSYVRHSDKPAVNDLSYPELYSVCIDTEGNLWSGTAGKGIRRLNPETGEYKDFLSMPTDSSGLLSNYVHTLYCDREGMIWIGTNAGLDRLDYRTETFTHLTTEHGLAGNAVQSICEGEPGILYVGTNKGLSWINIRTKEMVHYSTDNALLANDFLPDAVCRRTTGEIVMGTNKGIVSFHPAELAGKQAEELALVRIHPAIRPNVPEKGSWIRYAAWIIPGGFVLLLILLGWKRKRRKQHRIEVYTDPEETETAEESPLSEGEREFVRRATEVVLQNLQNPQFDVDMFCSAMAMSRANLFRKLKATTGFSASAFTRDIRIRQAADMLRRKEYTINEVATRVGFSDPNYFSRCFKEVYGVTPSGFE